MVCPVALVTAHTSEPHGWSTAEGATTAGQAAASTTAGPGSKDLGICSQSSSRLVGAPSCDSVATYMQDVAGFAEDQLFGLSTPGALQYQSLCVCVYVL
jgi:hypothetical protein